MFRALQRALGFRHAGSRPSKRGLRLEVMCLEDRIVPRSYTWIGTGGANLAWSDQNNWSPVGIPGANNNADNDTVLFNATAAGGNAVPCNVLTDVTISRIEISDFNANILLEADLTIKQSAFQSSGLINGAGTVTVSTGATYTWRAGQIEGDRGSDQHAGMVIEAGGNLQIMGAADKYIDNRIIWNSGTITWTAPGISDQGNGDIFLSNSAAIDNASGSKFVASYGAGAIGAHKITGDNSPFAWFIVDAGARYEQSGGGTRIDLHFVNGGTVALAGESTLTLSAGSQSTGKFTLEDGTLYFSSGAGDQMAHALWDAIVEGGNASIEGANTLVNIWGDVYIDNLSQDSVATLDGDGMLYIKQSFNWRGGPWKGGEGNRGRVYISQNAALTITGEGGGGPATMGRTLNNWGTVTWSGSYDLNVTNNAYINNYWGPPGTTPTFEIKTGRDINDGGAGVFTNWGIVRKTMGTMAGNTTINVRFLNKPGGKYVEEPNAGTVIFSKKVENQGAIQLEGPAMVAQAGLEQDETGSIELYDGSTLTVDGDFLQTGGLVHEIGPENCTVLVSGDFTQQAGETLIEGDDSTFTVQGDFIQTGGTTQDTGAPDSGITVTGDFQQSGGTSQFGFGGGLVARSVDLSGGLMVLRVTDRPYTVSVSAQDANSVGGFRIGAGTNSIGVNGGGAGELDCEEQGASINGNVINGGIVTLGKSSAQGLVIHGNYTQENAGVLNAWLGATLRVSGTAIFAGVLNVEPTTPVTGTPGTYSVLVSFGGWNNTFYGITSFPPLDPNVYGHWVLRYNVPTGTLSLWLDPDDGYGGGPGTP